MIRGTHVARVTAWTGLAIVVTLGALISILPDTRDLRALGDTLYLFSLFASMVLAGVCAWRVGGVERRLWTTLGVALVLTAIAESYWTWYVAAIDPHGPPLPHPFELIQLAAAFAFVLMIVTMTEFGSDPWPTRLRIYMDILAGQLVLFALVYLFWTEPLFDETPIGDHALAWIGAIYPVVGITILVGVAFILGRRPSRTRMWEALVIGAVAFFAAGSVAWPAWYVGVQLSNQPQSSGLFIMLSIAGYGALALGMVYRLTDPADMPFVPRRFPHASSPWPSAVFAAFLGTSVVALFVAAHATPWPDDAQVLLVTAIALALVTGLRSVALSMERAAQRRRAATDPITGLALLSEMRDTLDRAIESSHQAHAPLCIGAFAVDGYKSLVGIYGVEVVDELRTDVGRRLGEASGRRVFLLSESTFVLIFDPSETDVLREVRRTLTFAQSTRVLGDVPVDLVAAIARYPRDGSDAEALLEGVRTALDSRVAVPSSVIEVSDVPMNSDDASQRAEERGRARVAAVRALASALEQREVASTGQGRAVAELSRRLGEVMGLSTEDLRSLELAALVHDVGKVGVPDRLLGKPGVLSEREFEQMEEHTVLGQRILDAAGMPEIGQWVRSHHERWDGGGYPDGLKGEEIPLASRILNVTSSFEAMTSTRAWRTPVPLHEAVAELQSCAGSQFDPRIVDVFTRLVQGMQTAPAPITLERLGLEG